MRAAETAPPIRRNVREHDAVPRQRKRRLLPCLSLCASFGAVVLGGSPLAQAQDTPVAPPATVEHTPVVGGPAAPQPTVQAEAPGA